MFLLLLYSNNCTCFRALNLRLFTMYILYKIVVVRPSVCPLQKVSGNDLTSRHKMQYLWLPTVRG